MDDTGNPFVHSYLFLRRAIGCIGVALPFVLVVGQLIVDGTVRHSVSAYYYSDMRDVYVGSLCAVGVFLLAYRGYGTADEVAGDIAAVAAVGVALFPTSPANPSAGQRVVGTMHLVFAGVFFLTLAFFCLFLFTRSRGPRTARKVHRNRIYYAAGAVILVCLAGIAVGALLLPESSHAVLVMEAAAIVAFGISWLIKGETILRDAPASVRR